jgi:hypothetical protein
MVAERMARATRPAAVTDQGVVRRSDRTAKLKDPLRVISCGHCKRLIDFMDSPAHAPPGTDPGLLHSIAVPKPPGYSVLCTCGHYTFYVREGDPRAYQTERRQ